jgi:hypothetical protein
MIKCLPSLSIVILITAFCTVPDEVAANTLSASDKRVAGCHIETLGAHNALREISQRADVAIGIEAVQPENEKPIVLDFPGGTVADLLNSLWPNLPTTHGEKTAASYMYFAKTLMFHWPMW